MKFKPLLGAQLSGSMGAITASHNRGGTYFRQRATPVNPNSPQQQAVRAIMTALNVSWNVSLTAIQRAAWDTYAANTPLTDVLGEQIHVGGKEMYARSNVSRIQAGFTRIDDAPTIFDLAELNPATATYTTATSVINVAFDDNDPWVTDDNGLLFVYTSRQQNPSINFFKGPYRLAGTVEGDSGTPPTSPAAISAAFPCAIANRCFFMLRAQTGDGRLSPPFRGFAVGSI